MYQGVIFFDYDGTLADEREGIELPTPKTVEAVSRLQSKGYLIVLATGRSRCYVPDVGISFDGYVTNNGAHAEVNGKCVLNQLIPDDIMRDAIAYMDARGIGYALETPSVCYARNLKDPTFNAVLDNFNIPRDVFVLLDPANPPKANKMFLTYDSYGIEDGFKRHFQGRLSMKRHRFCTSWDVDLDGVTKADGVRAILESFGVDRASSYAFGDGVNDLTMLSAVGHGIAMKEHAACLEDAAELITGSVKDEGICMGLNYFGLL